MPTGPGNRPTGFLGWEQRSSRQYPALRRRLEFPPLLERATAPALPLLRDAHPEPELREGWGERLVERPVPHPLLAGCTSSPSSSMRTIGRYAPCSVPESGCRSQTIEEE